MTALEPMRGLVVLDEVQRRQDLFPVLRVLADRKPTRARFLILGSASPTLLRQGSESLAGRMEIIEMSGFTYSEVGGEREVRKLWVRGAFPRSFLARSSSASKTWREDFISTFLERDLPQLGLNLPALTMRRFWTLECLGQQEVSVLRTTESRSPPRREALCAILGDPQPAGASLLNADYNMTSESIL